MRLPAGLFDRERLPEKILICLITSLNTAFNILTLDRRFYIDPSSVMKFMKAPSFFIVCALLFIFIFCGLLLLSMVSKNLPLTRQENFMLSMFSIVLFVGSIFMVRMKYNHSVSLLPVSNIILGFQIFVFFTVIGLDLPFDVTKETGRAFAFITAAAVILGLFSFSRTLSYYTSYHTMTDMSIYLNTMWQHGANLPAVPWMERGLGTVQRAAFHVYPIDYVFSLFSRLKNFPEIMLFVQSAGAYASVIFMFLLFKQVLKDELVALLLALAYAINPFLARSVDFDFHFDFIFPAVAAAFLYFSGKGNFIAALIAAIIGISAKEEISMYFGFMAIFAFMRGRDKKYLWLSGAAFIYFIAVVGFLIPAHNAYAKNTFADITMGLLSQLGNLLKPNLLTQLVFSYLAPVLLLCLMPTAALLLIMAPVFAVHLTNSVMWNTIFFFQYHAFTLPVLFISAVFGMEYLIRKLKPIADNILGFAILIFISNLMLHISWYLSPDKYNSFVLLPVILFGAAGALLLVRRYKKAGIACLCALAVFVYFAGYYMAGIDKAAIQPEKKQALDEAVKLVPADPDIPVLCGAEITSHLSARKYLSDLGYYNGNENTVFNRITRGNFKEFYMLVDTISDDVINQNKQVSVFKGIEKLAIEQKYNEKEIYNKNGIELMEFNR